MCLAHSKKRFKTSLAEYRGWWVGQITSRTRNSDVAVGNPFLYFFHFSFSFSSASFPIRIAVRKFAIWVGSLLLFAVWVLSVSSPESYSCWIWSNFHPWIPAPQFVQLASFVRAVWWGAFPSHSFVVFSCREMNMFSVFLASSSCREVSDAVSLSGFGSSCREYLSKRSVPFSRGFLLWHFRPCIKYDFFIFFKSDWKIVLIFVLTINANQIVHFLIIYVLPFWLYTSCRMTSGLGFCVCVCEILEYGLIRWPEIYPIWRIWACVSHIYCSSGNYEK